MNLTITKVSVPFAILMVVAAVTAAPVTAETLSYESAQSFLDLMTKSVKSASSKEVTVSEHSDEIGDFDPNNLESLLAFVKDHASRTKTTDNARIVDRKFQMVGDNLSLCLGAVFPEGTVADLTVCQDFQTNLLNRVIVKNSDGAVIGKYEIK
ncbi:MAG: hypothetical protein ABEK50_03855 [bacterium]